MPHHPKYFSSIALGLPGGGYRAAAFALGILRLLHKVGLSDSIKAISTVSGGSITGVKYAQMMADGHSFEDFYNEMYNWLSTDSLFDAAITSLKHPQEFIYKRHNLINACAIQYNDFIPGNFKTLEEGLKNNNGLEEVIFNATDFKNGLAFRFRNKGVFGNGRERYEDEIKSSVKLGDIVAASSCFPGGFEPIEFPQDFMKEHQGINPVALMDGGIIDNQGTSSYLTTDKLRYETYLIADAGQSEIDPFEFADHNKWTRRISIILSPWVLFILIVISILLFCIKSYIALYLLSIITVFVGVLQIGLLFVLKFASERVGVKKTLQLSKRNIGIYLLDRINSLLLLNTSIFLKSAKSRNISALYERDPRRVSKISIYDVLIKEGDEKPSNFKNWDKVKSFIGGIPDKINRKALLAQQMGTTLWFGEENIDNKMLDALIDTGAATCCINLLGHMIDNEEAGEFLEHTFIDKLVGIWKDMGIENA